MVGSATTKPLNDHLKRRRLTLRPIAEKVLKQSSWIKKILFGWYFFLGAWYCSFALNLPYFVYKPRSPHRWYKLWQLYFVSWNLIGSKSAVVIVKLNAILEETDSTCVNVIGDFNSNLMKSESQFANYLAQYCELFEYKWSSKLLGLITVSLLKMVISW